MIGNDIIDLSAARRESNWQRKGYLNKLFNLEEQQLIIKSSFPDITVWSLWSMKEAVYKAEFRRTLHFEYAPLKINCIKVKESNNFLESELIYNEIKYFCQTSIFSEYIHTIACRWKKDFFHVRKMETKDYPENYIPFLKNENLILKNEMIVKNNVGIPNLIDVELEKIYPLSISHHGKFLGAATLLSYAF